MIIKGSFTLLGIFIFLFLFWRRLKEDYTPNQIFGTAFYALFGALGANLISIYFLPSWWFWLDLFGALLGVTLGILRFHLRVFETLEALVLATLPWFGLILLSDFIETTGVSSGVGATVILVLVGLFYFLDTHYKGFTWYKSGRVGFSGLTVAGAFFLIRAAVAATSVNVLSFVNGKEAVLSGLLAFVSFLAVYNLAKEKT